MTTAASRRRRAEVARPVSDLWRGRGVALGALGGALVLVVVLALRDGTSALLSPGPLARPHAAAACTNCHAPSSPAPRCDGCHVQHASRRTPHAALAAQGALPCERCHRMHGRDAALVFEPNGSVTLAAGGAERELAQGAVSVVARETFVPLVAAATCARCHALERALDPASACVTQGPDAVALCFDEHRGIATHGSGAFPERDGAVEAARVLLRAPGVRQRLTRSTNKQSNGAVVVLALGVAALVVTERRRRLSAPRPNPPPRPSTQLASSQRKLPVIDAARCLGCHACVDACPFDALALERYVAVLERPDACCGGGPCEQSCPNGSLRLLATGSPPRGPRLTPELEVPERPGLFLAGDLTGGALIRNAVRQGAAVARTVADRLAREAKSGAPHVAMPLDLLVVGAGPSGLSAGLVARSRGLRVVVVDQAGVAASIRRFSRQKLVLDAPPATEEKLPLWLGDATKEELVARWEHTLRRARLDVREGVQVLAARVTSDASLIVHARGGAGDVLEFSSRYVLLAIGTRGTPRPLEVPVPDAAAARVHYELSDARVFAGQRCIIVGLGDVAMESALALAAQPDCEVTIVHRGAGFACGSRRNIDAVARLAASRRIRLVFAARVAAVRAASLEIEVAGASRGLGYDALFVHVGQVPSGSLLASFGVCVPP